MAQIFKIRRRSDGLFSTGGSYPSFKKEGKVWSRRGNVSSHFAQMQRSSAYLADCEVVVYELVESEIIPVSDWITTIENNKHFREMKRQQAQDEYLKNVRREQFEKLRKEFEPNQ